MSKRAAMKVERVPIGDLTPHPENPRQGDVGAISESITRFGLYQPIVVQLSSRYILVGNHRWKAARTLGMESMPVVYLDVDDITAKAILVADNRLSDIATYDDHVLAGLLGALQREGALEMTGYDDEDVCTIVERLEPLRLVDWERVARQACDLLLRVRDGEAPQSEIALFLTSVPDPLRRSA